jgi:hypothetical protein
VRPDGDDFPAATANPLADGVYGFARDAKLGRGATPEEIAGRRGDNGEIGPEIFDGGGNGERINRSRRGAELAIDDQGFVPGSLQQRFGVTEFKRKMRLTASEVDAALEAPCGVDESESQGERP